MLDNKNFIIGIVLITVLIALGMLKASTDISEKLALDSDSADYIAKYENLTIATGIPEFEENAVNSEKKTNTLLEKLAGLPIVENFLGAAFFFIDAVDAVFNFGQFLYNIPSFLVESLGMDVGAFRDYLNVLVYAFTIGILIFLVGLAK